MALQALAMYSEKTQGNALDLRVKMTSELDSDWKPPEIHITQENALLRRQIDVSLGSRSHFNALYSGFTWECSIPGSLFLSPLWSSSGLVRDCDRMPKKSSTR